LSNRSGNLKASELLAVVGRRLMKAARAIPNPDCDSELP